MILQLSSISEVFETNGALSRIHVMNGSLVIVVFNTMTKLSIAEFAIVMHRILLMILKLSNISELFETNSTLSRIHVMNCSLMLVVFNTLTKLSIAKFAITV